MVQRNIWVKNMLQDGELYLHGKDAREDAASASGRHGRDREKKKPDVTRVACLENVQVDGSLSRER
jgi:hypothetical protein